MTVASMLSVLLCGAEFAVAQSESTPPIRTSGGFFALPVELDLDSGAANGDASILRIMPLYTLPVFERWKLVHLDIITLADAPGGTPAFPGGPSTPDPDQKFGMSDLLHASFFTSTVNHSFVWGIGPVMSVPTATDDSLGSGKWAAGPAFRLTYRTAKWNLGLVAAQRWSFAGSSNRKDVNQLLLRGAVRRQLGNNWYFVSAPIIVADWDAADQKWLVPLGGGIGRRFNIGNYPWAISLQGYVNAIKPDPAPDWLVRFSIIAAIPFGND